jgi:glycosyltransferase involved in cell wall biosynthesis
MKAAPGLIWSIRRFLAARGARVVHSHNMAPLVYAGVCARMVRGRPAVVYSEHNQVYSATPAARKRFSYYVRLADEVVAVSHDLERTLTEEIGIRRPVRVIYNGIDGRRFADTGGEKVRRELGFGDDDLVVGTAVVLSEQKGIAYLLEAARRVLDAEPRARFVIGGEGPLRQRLEARAAELALGDRVRFLGYRRDVPDLISSLDLYVLPSLWEGLPLALLEALAIGKPIVCTTVGGNPEIVEDGVNGFLVPPRQPEPLADRILRALRDRGFREAARQRNQKKFADVFSVDKMVDGHASLYRDLASRRA